MKRQFTRVNNKQQAAKAARLAKEIWEEYYPDIITREQITYMIATFQSAGAIENQIREGMHYYLITGDDDEIGYFAYNADENNFLLLSKIYIKKEFRNTGQGREAFDFIVREAKKSHYSKIWLTVNKNNRASIDKYLQMGFIITDSVIKDIGSGFVMDDYVMEYKV
jgi:ribosomal protein S18 acetylase RimI-like enzyme